MFKVELHLFTMAYRDWIIVEFWWMILWEMIVLVFWLWENGWDLLRSNFQDQGLLPVFETVQFHPFKSLFIVSKNIDFYILKMVFEYVEKLTGYQNQIKLIVFISILSIVGSTTPLFIHTRLLLSKWLVPVQLIHRWYFISNKGYFY